MIRRIPFLAAFTRALWHDRRGVAIPLVAVTAVVLFLTAGIALDVGSALAVRSQLQATTDAAAIAGAQEVACSTCTVAGAIATATNYASVAGSKNVIGKVTVTMASGYPQAKCFQSTGASCGVSGANGVIVKQVATVPTNFARLLGINSFTLHTTSTAGGGGPSIPANIMFVLDTTQSMTAPDPACGNITKEDCAKEGIRAIMSALSTTSDKIGLMVFPGLTSTTPVSKDYNCKPGSLSSNNVAIYGSTPAPVYQISGLSSDYLTPSSNGGNSQTLNPNSNLANAVGGNGSSGVCDPGGVGTYLADAINQAQATLAANAQPGVQNVIILLSDGDVTATSSKQIVASESSNGCHAAINAAQAATKAGTWVYSVAYQADPTIKCSNDTITACYTMQQIASDSTKFYSDNSTACKSTTNSYSGLVQALQGVAQSLLKSRILPDNAT